MESNKVYFTFNAKVKYKRSSDKIFNFDITGVKVYVVFTTFLDQLLFNAEILANASLTLAGN